MNHKLDTTLAKMKISGSSYDEKCIPPSISLCKKLQGAGREFEDSSGSKA
jgi:hypothetical protein